MGDNVDNRNDKVEQIHAHIDRTIADKRLAEEMISQTTDESTIAGLTAKNERRDEALDGFRKELRDEAASSNAHV